ncbi:Uu.00g095190.m01.CDS01 [Anthostomella pinea]|uniref:Uu.00g095190.m01.CDS01 n=1 Tax=Anthostomella pinea TaxID=933095 RepID=A0AAI8YMV9_9PEZI|nr:Uu.00g095190.m01.CDS01 [Anthostomella pinea]
MQSFTKSLVLLVSFAGAILAAPTSSCHINANVCLGDHGSGTCLPTTYIPKTCYDLPSAWIGSVKTLTPLDDNAVCLANSYAPIYPFLSMHKSQELWLLTLFFPTSMSCTEAQQNICHDSPDCTGYVMPSKENPAGWDLTASGLMSKVVSFSCWKNGTLLGTPAAVSSLAGPAATAM